MPRAGALFPALRELRAFPGKYEQNQNNGITEQVEMIILAPQAENGVL